MKRAKIRGPETLKQLKMSKNCKIKKVSNLNTDIWFEISIMKSYVKYRKKCIRYKFTASINIGKYI